MEGYLEINPLALDAFDELGRGGVSSTTTSAPILAAFERAQQASDLRHEFELLDQAGQHVEVTELAHVDVLRRAPHIAGRMELVLQLHGQRFLDPGVYVHALADSVWRGVEPFEPE